MMFFIAIIFVVACGVGYLIWVWGGAYVEVKAAPREEMFYCDKHGPIRKQHVIKFLDSDYCPICFHERSSKAERIHG